MPSFSFPFASCVILAASVAAGPVAAQSRASGWEAGVVVDVAANSRALAQGTRDQGAGLGHSDVLVRGPLGSQLSAEAIVGFHTEERKLESHVENAWLQTRALPYGLQLRAGRFASQVGYLNELHPHADDFVERPLLYRGFFGGHWYDDGLRLNWTAPTPFYLRLGAEAFSGRKLVREKAADSDSGVTTLSVKTGADFGVNHSWQLGVSRVHNRQQARVEAHDPAEAEHSHTHAAEFSGRRMWLGDLVWKWAPQGNNRNEQVRLVWEYARVSDINPFAQAGQRHGASSVSAVWRLNPAWEVGVRADGLRVHQAEEDAGEVLFAAGKLRESALMLAWKPTHAQTLRLQLTRQKARGENDEGEPVFANPASRSIQLQYVIGFGSHGAHAY